MVTGGFYSIEQKNRPTIVVLNTNYMGSNKDPFGQWKWLEKVLQDVRQKRRTVSELLFMWRLHKNIMI